MAGQSRTLKLSILADVDNLKKSLTTGSSDVDGFAGKIGDFSKKAAVAFAAAAAAAGTFALKIGIDAVKAASDLNETISKVGVLFGTSSKEIETFAASAAKSLGQTKQQALDAAATFATFGKAAGLTGKDLSNFSIDFIKLASDLASFNNTSPEQAINAIGAALRGEAEPLRAYGVLLDDASMRQAALELGIVSTTKNALTPQQKVLAAQELIFRQTGAAQGDFERTSDGLANKTRILTAELENAKVVIGEALLPIVLEIATFFSDNVIPIVNKVADAFGSSKDKESGLNGTLQTLVGIIQGLVLPIFNGMKKAFDAIKNTIIENKDEFASFFEVLKAAAPVIGSIIGKAFEVIGNIASMVLNVIANVSSAIQPLLNKAIDGINLVIRGLNLIKIGNDIPYLSKIGGGSPSAGGFSGTTPGGQSFTGNLTGSANNTKGSTGGNAVDVAVAAAAAVAASSAKQGLDNVVGGNFNPGQFRLGEAKSMQDFANFDPNRFSSGDKNNGSGNNYTINVTGAIDPIGVSRQIVNLLNNEATLSGTFDNLGGSRLVAAL
jgi:hypothetical protein